MLTPKFNMERDHYKGHPEASIELIEYGDYQCHYSAAAMPEIDQLLVALGTQVKYVFRHYPLPNLHPLALQAAIVTESAGLQERFWDMHEMILKIQK